MIRRLVKLAVSLGVLGLALYLLDWKTLGTALKRIGPKSFILAVSIGFFQSLILGLRWNYLTHRIIPLGPLHRLKYYLYSNLLNTVSPANFGGDLYRFFTLRFEVSTKTQLIAVLVRERALGFLSYFLTLMICVGVLAVTRPNLLSENHAFYYGGVVALVGILGFSLVPMSLRWIARWRLVANHNGSTTILPHLRQVFEFRTLGEMFVLIGLSLFALWAWILAVKVVAMDLDIRIPWLALGVVVVLADLIRLIPVSVQGIGVREGVYAYLLGSLGYSAESGFVLGAVSYLALTISLLMSGLVGWTMMQILDSHERGRGIGSVVKELDAPSPPRRMGE